MKFMSVFLHRIFIFVKNLIIQLFYFKIEVDHSSVTQPWYYYQE